MQESSVIFSNTGNQPTTFRSESFSRCSSLTTVVLPNSLKQLGIKAFAYTNISEIAIPHCDFINHDCFAFCSNLKRVRLLATSIVIEYAAFYEYRKLVNFYYCGKSVPQHNDNSMPYILLGLLENGKNVTSPNIEVHVSTLYPPNTTFPECSNLVYDSNLANRDNTYYSFFDQEVVIEYMGD